MNKTAKKTLIIIGSILGSLVGLFLLLYLILAIIGCVMYDEARDIRKYVCDVAGISDGNAPQGITYSKERDVYIQTGYDGDNTTLLYVTENGKSRRVKLADKDGKTLKGHAGGVTCTKDCVYIANGSNLHMFSLAELVGAGSDTIQVKRVFSVDNNAAYCYSDDIKLYVGEFYRAGNYETDTAHHYTTPNGQDNKAIVSVYALDSDGLLITENDGQPYPEYCISVTSLVQGFATTDGAFIMSRSYGLKNSSLEYYRTPEDSGTTITVKFKTNENAEQKQVPLYYLDNTALYKSVTLPSFSEDITIVNDRVVVTNEASANKYFIGKLFGAGNVYSYPIFKEK